MTQETPQTQTQTTPSEREIHDDRIFFAIPSYDAKLCVPFVSALMQVTRMPCTGTAQFVAGDSLVTRARNNLVASFMSGVPAVSSIGEKIRVMFDWLMFIDADIIFRPEYVAEMHVFAKRNGPGVYAGSYPLKCLTPKMNYNPAADARPDVAGWLPVSEVATGFMMIHRDVFRRMSDAGAPAFMTDNFDAGGPMQPRTDYFRAGVVHDSDLGYNRYLSEDWMFCREWRRLGGQVLVNVNYGCGHIGTINFPVSPEDLKRALDAYDHHQVL